MHWKEQPCCNDSNGRRHKHSQQHYQLPFQPTPRGCYMLTVSLATINHTSLCPQTAHLALLCPHIMDQGLPLACVLHPTYCSGACSAILTLIILPSLFHPFKGVAEVSGMLHLSLWQRRRPRPAKQVVFQIQQGSCPPQPPLKASAHNIPATGQATKHPNMIPVYRGVVV